MVSGRGPAMQALDTLIAAKSKAARKASGRDIGRLL
jgi:hypothetical protein